MTTTERTPALGETREKAWKTRRDKYGPRGHSGAYSRAPANTGALNLVIRMLREGVLSEGQVQAATGLDRVEIRRLADSGEAGLAGDEADAIGVVNQAHPNPKPEGEAVAWRVKDYADGWIVYADEEFARRSDEARNGARVQPLYAHPAPEPVEGIREKVIQAAKLVFAEKRPGYHDCIDAGEPQCAWCDLEEALSALQSGERS